LDNHDEQRLASPEFAGTPEKENLDGCFHNNKFSAHNDLFWSGCRRLVMKMEVSERILELQFFDYVGVPSHQRG
jgi:hypothetical protein